MDFSIGNLFAFMVGAAMLTLFISPAWLFCELLNTTPYYFINLNTSFKRVARFFRFRERFSLWVCRGLANNDPCEGLYYPVKHKC